MNHAYPYLSLRTPLLPLSTYRAWINALATAARVDGMMLSPRTELQLFLACLTDEEKRKIDDALWYSSPVLYAMWDAHEPNKVSERVCESITNYLIRMSVRTNQYGLSATTSRVHLAGHETDIAVHPESDIRIATVSYIQFQRLSYRVLRALWPTTDALSYVVNSTMFNRTDGYLYYTREEEQRHTTSWYNFSLTKIQPPSSLRAILDTIQMSPGPKAFERILVDLIGQEVASLQSISRSEVDACIDELVENQVVFPVLPGKPGDVLEYETLFKIVEDSAGPLTGPLAHLRNAVRQINNEHKKSVREVYETYISKSEEVSTDPNKIFQFACLRPSSPNSVGKDRIERLSGVLATLNSISKSYESVYARLAERFNERYGLRPIPLLEAFDPERGFVPSSLGIVDYLEPLVTESGDVENEPLARTQYLISAILGSDAKIVDILSLDDSKLREKLWNKEATALLSAYTVSGTLIANDNSKDTSLEWLWLHSYSRPESILGRFSPIDADVTTVLQKIIKSYEDAGHVAATLVHAPAGQDIGNVTTYGFLTKYRIPIAAACPTDDTTIFPSELYISCSGGRFRLWCPRLKKDVIPILANAHNYESPNQLPIYQFLAGFRLQDMRTLPQWVWPEAMALMPKLPRVTLDGVIVSPRSWIVDEDTVRLLTDSPRNDYHAWGRQMALWMAHAGAPPELMLYESDQTIFIDLRSSTSLASLRRFAIGRKSIRLFEQLPRSSLVRCGATDLEMNNELLVTAIAVDIVGASENRVSTGKAREVPNGVRWCKAVDQGWFYLKLYGNAATLEEIIRQDLTNLLVGAKKWFFIRYDDGLPHLRIRVQTKNHQDYSDIHARFMEYVSANLGSRIIKVQTEIYEREIERYGGERGIRIAEGMFWIDSSQVLAFLSGVSERTWQERLIFSVETIDDFFQSFGVDLPERLQYVRKWSIQTGKTLGLASNKISHSESVFRKLRSDLLYSLKAGQSGAGTYKIVKRRFARHFRRLNRDNRLSTSLENIILSLSHLHVNRTFPFRPWQSERLVYDVLGRCYMTLIHSKGEL